MKKEAKLSDMDSESISEVKIEGGAALNVFRDLYAASSDEPCLQVEAITSN